MPNNKIVSILEYAISREEEAYEFYTELAEGSQKSQVKAVFSQFAKEELGHKKKLEDIKAIRKNFPEEKEVKDLKIAEYLVDVDEESDKGLDYQQALILAMKREKAAFKLYTDLAEVSDNEDWQRTFLALAQEEAKHKLRFELEYDDEILREN